MTGRSKTLPWLLGGRRIKMTENKIYCPYGSVRDIWPNKENNNSLLLLICYIRSFHSSLLYYADLNNFSLRKALKKWFVKKSKCKNRIKFVTVLLYMTSHSSRLQNHKTSVSRPLVPRNLILFAASPMRPHSVSLRSKET
jgi:hypothetical protein